MIQTALPANHGRKFTISPFLELGAYEALWADPRTTFKRVADLFRRNPEYLPSSFVPKEDAINAGNKVLAKLSSVGIEHFGVRVHRAAEYPEKLRDAQNPVEVLYYQGWWDLVETRCVAVVGSRKISPDGINRAKRLTKCLVEDDFTIVSGLAKGVDTVAHTTAIECGGRTIAVIGTPLTEYYPRENKKLQREIAQKHLLISQVPVLRYEMQDYRRNKEFFPERNKTMSALTEATIIVEASDTSGSLIQARAAFHQGRKLFILDNCFQNKDLTWPSHFEKMGAIRVKEYEDIHKVLAPKCTARSTN